MKISGTATVEFNFPVEEDFENFAVIDEQGREAVFDVIRKDAYCMKTTSPINLRVRLIATVILSSWLSMRLSQ